MHIYTAQYSYSNVDRLDITVKGQDPLGKHFAPTWEMVMGIKNSTMTQEQYESQYAKIINQAPKEAWEELLSFAYHRGCVTFVCFCKAGEFCHRVLLARWLSAAGWGEFIGERS